MKTIVIIGAGLFGITLAQIVSNYRKVILVEKRNEIGGNCFDYIDEITGIYVHKYGPHILHIQDKNVYNYLSKFTEFNNYKHHVLSYYKNKIYEFPINLSTINAFYGTNLRPYEVNKFLELEVAKQMVHNPQNLEEKIIGLIGFPLYEAFFKEYTIKQWGKEPRELPANIINRIPIKVNYDTNYYKKLFNGIPSDGYTKMFTRMLSNKNISIEIGVNFFQDREYFIKKGPIIYTGPIDDFFNCIYGKLEYRSLRFEKEMYEVSDWQGNSVINYPELKYEYTRICEPKHFYPEKWHKFSDNKTLIFKEIPFIGQNDDPYYPIQDYFNTQIYNKYYKETLKLSNIYFGGRLGEYKYYDMEDTIKSAFNLSKKILS